MQLPLLHRTTQMALLKKLIRRKTRELRRRKHRAHRRLVMMRRIRKALLLQMRYSIDLRQRDAEQERREQARRAVGSMLHLYKGYLRNWSRALSNQSRLIRQQEQLKRRLDRKLKLLRKRLRKHRRPRHLVDRCFQNLAKAVRKWQQGPNYIEGQKHIWEQEAEEVRQYLSDFRRRPSKKRKSRRRRVTLDLDLPNLTRFWKAEVLPKKKPHETHSPSKETRPDWAETGPYKEVKTRIIKSKVAPKSKPNHLNPNIDDITIHQGRRKRLKSTRRQKVPSGPSLGELKQVLADLLTYNPTEKKIRRAFRVKRKLHKKSDKVDQYKELEKAIKNTKPKSIYLFRKHKKNYKHQRKPDNIKRLLDIGSATKAKILESRVVLLKKGEKGRNKYKRIAKLPPLHFHWPTNVRKHILAKQKQRTRQKNQTKKPKYKFVDDSIKGELNALVKSRKKDRRRSKKKKSITASSSLSMPGISLHRVKVKRKHKMAKGQVRLGSQLSDNGSQLMLERLRKRRKHRKYEKTPSVLSLGRDSVISLSESLNKLIMESRRKSPRKSIRGMGVTLDLPEAHKTPIAKKSAPAQSIHQYLSQKNKHLGTSLSEHGRPKIAKRLAPRISVSEPFVPKHLPFLRSFDRRWLRRPKASSSAKGYDLHKARSYNVSRARSSARLSKRSFDGVRNPFAVEDSNVDLLPGKRNWRRSATSDQANTTGRGNNISRVADQIRKQAEMAGKLSNRISEIMSNRSGDSISNRAGDIISNQVETGDNISNRISKETSNRIGDTISNRARDQIRNPVETDDIISNRISKETSNRIGDTISNRARDQIRNQVETDDIISNRISKRRTGDSISYLAGDQIRKQVEGAGKTNNRISGILSNQIRDSISIRAGEHIRYSDGARKMHNRMSEGMINRIDDSMSNQAVDNKSNQAKMGDIIGNEIIERMGNRIGDSISNRAGDIIINQAEMGDIIGNQVSERMDNRIGDSISNRSGDIISKRISELISNRVGSKTDNQNVDHDMSQLKALIQNLQKPGNVTFDQVRENLKKMIDYEPLSDIDKLIGDRTESRYTLYSIATKAGRKKHPDVNDDPKKDPGIRKIGTPKLSVFRLSDMVSDPKYKDVQNFLKDVIEKNQILENTVDTRGLMSVVGKHFMWSTLNDLYSEMLAGGIDILAVKRLLTGKYLDYLKNIQTDYNFALVGPIKRVSTEMDQLFGKQFGTRKTEPKAQDAQMLSKKLMEQEMNAEHPKVQKGLFPTNSRLLSSISSTSLWDLAPNEEQDLRDAEERYSINNIRIMMNEHKARFQAAELSQKMAEVRRKKLEVEAKLEEMRSICVIKLPPPKSPEKTSMPSSKKKGKRRLRRPIEQLYYAPRLTCRQRKIIQSYSEEDALEEDEESSERCPRCGRVQVDEVSSSPSLEASSTILSRGSIEACAKSELLVNTISDICTRCGYVHDEAEPCSQVAEDPRKTVFLRMIKAVQAVRSGQATQCPAFCSPRELRREKDLRSSNSHWSTKCGDAGI